MGLIPRLNVDTPCSYVYTVLDPIVPPFPSLPLLSPPCPDDASNTEPNETRRLPYGPPNGVEPNVGPLIGIGLTWGPPITGMDTGDDIATYG